MCYFLIHTHPLPTTLHSPSWANTLYFPLHHHLTYSYLLYVRLFIISTIMFLKYTGKWGWDMTSKTLSVFHNTSTRHPVTTTKDSFLFSIQFNKHLFRPYHKMFSGRKAFTGFKSLAQSVRGEEYQLLRKDSDPRVSCVCACLLK